MTADAPPPPSKLAIKDQSYSPATLAIHADDRLNAHTADVAPALHVSTTFRYSNNPTDLVPAADEDCDIDNAPLVYSRVSAPNTTRLEAILASLCKGHALTYSSGLAAFFALLTYLKPKVIAIGGGYHGCHGVIDVHSKLTGLKKVDLHDEKSWDEAGLGKGDIVHVETPNNPTGSALNLEEFAEKARKRGAYLTVDSTFGPPGLQDPFAQGADYILHSGTKYLGGHSDMLCGVLVTKDREAWEKMWAERIYLGSVMGSMEGWLGVRSVRTLEIRVQTQSRSAEMLARWLDACVDPSDTTDEGEIVKKVISKVVHSSLQEEDMSWLSKQMPGGHGPVFAMHAKSMEMARALPSKLHLFHHATSLGGVESLIEWRRMSDLTCPDTLLRMSIGVEAFEDLKRDLLDGFKALAEEGASQADTQMPIQTKEGTGLPT